MAVTTMLVTLMALTAVHAQTFQNGCTGDFGENVFCNQNEYIPYDGYFHNFAEPTWGAIDMPYARKMITAYEDGAGFKPSGHNRPNARMISRGLMSGPSGHGSYRRRSALMTFFGQQVVEEVLDTQVSGCTPEYIHIPIPAGDDLFDPAGHGDVFIPLLRSRYAADTGNAPNNPRQQLNLITPFFDGNLLYGENKFTADALRAFHHGFLKTNDTLNDLSYECGAQLDSCPTLGRTAFGYKGVYPNTNEVGLPIANPPQPADQWPDIVEEISRNGGKINNLVNGGRSVTRVYTIGGLRANENPMLLSWGIFLFRLHNRYAYIEQQHLCHEEMAREGSVVGTDDPYNSTDPSCYNWLSSQHHLDEEIYAVARMWVIAVHQHIVAHEWIPAFIGAERCIDAVEQKAVEDAGLRCALPAYSGYDEDIYPQVSEIFQTAAMRFGHTFVTPGIFLRQTKVNDPSYSGDIISKAEGPTYNDPNANLGGGQYGNQLGLSRADDATTANTLTCDFLDEYSALDVGGHNAPKESHSAEFRDQRGTVRTANSFLRGPEFMYEHGWEAIIQGLSSQVAEREDTTITPDLRGFVFGFNDFTRRDLMAVNIHRARDHGLPDYVTARLAFELPAPGLSNPYHNTEADGEAYQAVEDKITALREAHACIDFCCQTEEETSITGTAYGAGATHNNTLGGKSYNAMNLDGSLADGLDPLSGKPMCTPINTFRGNAYWLTGWAGDLGASVLDGNFDVVPQTRAQVGGGPFMTDPISQETREIETYIDNTSECFDESCCEAYPITESTVCTCDPYRHCGICDVMCSIHGGPGPLSRLDFGTEVGGLHLVDIWTGGLMETTKDGVGALFYEAITDVYGRARDGDRFWFQNLNESPGTRNGFFSETDIRSILDTNMADLLRDIARPDYERCITDENGIEDCSTYTFSIQDEPFIVPDEGERKAVCVQPNQLTGEQFGNPCMTVEFSRDQFGNPGQGQCVRTDEDGDAYDPANPTYDHLDTDPFDHVLQGNMQKPPLGWAVDNTPCPASGCVPGTSGRAACGDFPQEVNRIVSGNYWFSAGFDIDGNAACANLKTWISEHNILPTTITELYDECVVRGGSSHECDIVRGYDSRYTSCRSSAQLQQSYECQAVEGNEGLFRISNMQHLDYYVTSKYHIAGTCAVVVAATLLVFGLALMVTRPVKRAKPAPKKEIENVEAVQASSIFKSMASAATSILGGSSILQQEGRTLEQLENFVNQAYLQQGDGVFKFQWPGERQNATLTASEFEKCLGEDPDSILSRNLFDYIREDSPRLDFEKFAKFLEKVRDYDDPEHIIDFMFNMIAGQKDHMTVRDFCDAIEVAVKSVNYPLAHGKMDELQKTLTTFVIPHITEGASTEKMTKDDFHKFVATAFLQDDIDEAKLERELHNKDGFLTNLTLTCFKRQVVIGHKVKKPQAAKERVSFIASLKKSIVLHKLNIFWFIVYMLTLFGVCGERAYYYSHIAEVGGLRQVAGYGVTVTRFAASGIMMNFAFVLFPVAQNFWTLVHDTPFAKFLPLDNYLEWHIFIGIMALLYSILHTLGHFVNFYNLSTQPNFDINCLFREVYITSHKLQSFAGYWLFGTMTGCTGWLLVVVLVIFYSFAMPIVQKKGKAYFKAVHTTLYPIIMLLIVLHGAGMLVQEPQFYIFFLPPAILFLIDRLLQISHTGYYAQMTEETEVLAYNPPVVKLILKRPFGWTYKGGQHARISCPAAQLGRNVIGAARDKFRPFTISSAPSESTVSFHIEVHPYKSGGSGWTENLMEVIERTKKLGQPLPPVLLDGPYGGTHQHYDENNKALVLFASGIGMTPFASIVKDMLFKIKVGKAVGRPLTITHIYMLWSVRELKQTSWFLSALKEIDEVDESGIVHPSLFVSRSGGKSDIKLAPLYILERWLGKHENPETKHTSTFLTGTRFRIHFERMPMQSIITKIAKEFAGEDVGCYACGGPGFLSGLRKAYSLSGRPFGQLHDEPFY